MGLRTDGQTSPPGFATVALGWLVRSPLFGALVWVAVYSTRDAALAKPKAAISARFEGFKRQMSEVGGEVAQDSALARLLSNTLEIIAKPPWVIYDAHGLPASPAQEMAKVSGDVTKALGRNLERLLTWQVLHPFTGLFTLLGQKSPNMAKNGDT